jgi:hypothetical protein
MTALVQFAPSPLAPFQFQAVLDGSIYNCTVTWALFGARWFLNIYGQDGILIVSLPNIGSPPDYDFSLTAGYFQTKIVFREAVQIYEIG